MMLALILINEYIGYDADNGAEWTARLIIMILVSMLMSGQLG